MSSVAPQPRDGQVPEHSGTSSTTTDPSGNLGGIPREGLLDERAGRRLNNSWVIGLFGTAVGAGILFLPMRAGGSGLWPLIIVTVLIGPMTYLSHRALSRIICYSPRKGEDVTVVAGDYFGKGWGKFITVLYFFAIYPIVLIYGVGITNTVDSFMVNQLGLPQIPRVILAGVLVAAMMAVMLFGEKVMLAVTNAIVWPLIILLLGLSLYLIPSWDFSGFAASPTGMDLVWAVFLIIPVLVFAFNHSPAISQFSLSMQRAHGERSADNASAVLKKTAAILVVFTMLFVWSCSLALGTDGLAEATEQNLPVLSYLANVNDSPIVSYAGPIIAMAAIASSFFGHYLGAAEGAVGLLRGFAPSWAERTGTRKLNIGAAAFIFLTTWAAGVLNPSILDLIDTLSGPVIASILYLMPMIAIYTVNSLAKYRKSATNWFVIITGVIAISGILVRVVQSLS